MRQVRYAATTTVSAERSKAEIESLLARYGATSFVSGWGAEASGPLAKIGFYMDGRQIRFELPLPDKNDTRFHKTPTGRTRRNAARAYQEWEQSTRQSWRALLLVVKAKLEAVAAGITTFEEEFMAHIVMPNGKTVGDMAKPAIDAAYKTGKVTGLLTGW